MHNRSKLTTNVKVNTQHFNHFVSAMFLNTFEDVLISAHVLVTVFCYLHNIFFRASTPAVWLTQPPIQWILGLFLLGKVAGA
jgi:hypothetical protein